MWPNPRWHHICTNDVTGCAWVCQNGIRAPRVHFLAYFTALTWKTRKDTTWSMFLNTMRCFLVMGLEQWVSITLKHIQCFHISDNGPWNMSPLSCSCHHVVKWWGFLLMWNNNIYWTNIHIWAPWDLDAMCHKKWETKIYIYGRKCVLNQLIEGSVLEMKQVIIQHWLTCGSLQVITSASHIKPGTSL